MMKLTPKQKAFCEYYAASGNATDAARKAGYSPKTAEAIGLENLRKPRVKAYIEELSQRAKDARFLAIEERREILAKIARDGYDALTCKNDIDSAARQTAIKAIDTLNKMDGVYIQKQEVKEDVSAQVSVRWMRDGD